eukprot:scaffold22381_cov118-Isochrysis_galbana.AAC.2
MVLERRAPRRLCPSSDTVSTLPRLRSPKRANTALPPTALASLPPHEQLHTRARTPPAALLTPHHPFPPRRQVESLAAELEKRATDVIDSAESQEDAFRVLEFREAAYSLLDLALKFQMKRFLAHAHCQALLDQWWRGAHKASNAAVHENVSMTTLLVQAVFPITNPHYRERAVELFKSSNGDVAPEKSRVVMDRSLRVARDAACHALAERKAEKTARPNSARRSGPDSDLTAKLKVQMDGLSARARGQGGTFDTAAAATADKLTGFYQIPSVVFVLRFFMHCLFLLFYTYILSLTDTSRLPDAYPPLTLTELLFMCWSVTIVLDDICNTLDEDQQSPPDALMIMRDVGMVACVAARLEAGTTHWPNAYMVYHTLLSFNIIFLAFALIEYRSYTRSIGVLYIMIKRMMSDLIIFMEVFVYIVIGFCLAFYGLYNAQDGVRLRSLEHAQGRPLQTPGQRRKQARLCCGCFTTSAASRLFSHPPPRPRVRLVPRRWTVRLKSPE